MKMAAVMKDATTAPLTFWQKSVNCWQIASQFALEFPLWAKYTIAAAAAAAEVVRVTITCINQIHKLCIIQDWSEFILSHESKKDDIH